MAKSRLGSLEIVPIFLACCGVVASISPCFSAEDSESQDALTFERHIRPLFRTHCFDCHGANEEREGSLDLRQVRLASKGGDSGPAIVPGDVGKSLLLKRIRSGEMPPGKTKLTTREVALVERWIAAGAKTARPEAETLDDGIGITPEDREFWAFQPIQRPAVPSLNSAAARVRTPIDAFLLRRLEEKGLGFAPDADRRTLIRRASFDLIGLPPTPDEVRAFVADDSPDAWERLIERLLDSPRYGERWARHWLDVAGYADSEGATLEDRARGYAWKYRDYVIRSFQSDKPFDRFLVEQLAGDELVARPYANLTSERIELLTATGFLRMAADGTANIDNAETRNQVVADTLKIVSTSLLGLSVGCAQCHDHRYDPILQTDYYRLRAVFEPSLNWKAWQNPVARRISLYTDADRAKAADVEKEATELTRLRNEKQARFMAAALETVLQKFPEEQRPALKAAYETPAAKRTAEQQQLLKENPSVNITAGVLYQYDPKGAEELKQDDQKIEAVRKQKPVEDFVRALWENPGDAPQTFLFHRGDHRQPKQSIEPGALTILAPAGARLDFATNDPATPSTGRKLAFARWLTGGKHPLAARVLVNRFWMHHFGRGLVATPSDFGRLGDRPSHPELLDWLASEFQSPESGAGAWSLKRFHKRVMLSTVYRQSSRPTEQAAAIDADNRLLSHFPVRRLDAEAIRDSVLFLNGTLDLATFGPPLEVKSDDAGQVVVPEAIRRRSIYLQVRRSQPVALLTAFDAPVIDVNCERRPSSTVATQALMLMNSDFALNEAARFAERVRNEAPAWTGEAIAGTEVPLRSPRVWSYGYGRFDESKGRMVDFSKLPFWTGSAWQGGPKLPDPNTGWASVRAMGGHPGNEAHAVVRRWTAPGTGFIEVTGALPHGSDKGDGVRSRIVSNRSGLAGEWKAKQGETKTNVAKIEVAAGDFIDFVTDRIGDESYDSFNWVFKVSWRDVSGKEISAWSSQAPFDGPEARPLIDQVVWAWNLIYGREPSRAELVRSLEFLGAQIRTMAATGQSADREKQAMTNFCQALISSNRYLYVD